MTEVAEYRRQRSKRFVRSGNTGATTLCALLLFGCATQDRAGVSQHAVVPFRHDSSGVPITEYQSVRNMPTAFQVESRPYFELGGTKSDPNEELDPRQTFLSATQLRNGSIVVNETSQIKFFDKRGRFLRAVGGIGTGPGQFEQTREVCKLRGDSLLVIEYASGRLILLNADGDHIQTFARPGFIPFGGCFPDGTVVAYRIEDRAATSLGRDYRPYSLLRLDGTRVQYLGEYPAPDYRGTIWYEPSILAFENEIFVADPKRYEIRVYSSSGVLRRVTRVLEVGPPITDDALRERAREMTKPMKDWPKTGELVERLVSANRQSTWPAFSRALVDSAKRVWVGDYQNRRIWTVFDSLGTALGVVQIPWPERLGATELVSIGLSHIVVRRVDSDGAPLLSFHRITSVRDKQGRQKK